MKYYLYIGDIPGDVQDGTYKGWFEVDSFDLDVLLSAGPGSIASFEPLTVNLDLGTSLPSFLQKVTGSTNISNVQLHQVADTGRINVFSLQNVMVKDVSNGSGPGDSITFDYTKIMMATGVRYPDGSIVVTDAVNWDVAANSGSSGGSITTPSATPSTAPAKPARYFLLVEGVDGGCREAGHVGWFEINTYDFDISNSGSAQTGTGVLSFSSLTVDLQLGTGVRDLLLKMASGKPFNGIKIDGVAADGQSVLDLRLANVLVTELDQGTGVDRVRFEYDKIGLATKGWKEDGTLVETIFGYDVARNIKLLDLSTLPSPMPGYPTLLRPMAREDSYTVEVGEAVTIAASSGVLANDSDPDGLALIVTKVNGSIAGAGTAIAGTFGFLSLNADGSFSYTANRSGSLGSGTDSFTYEIKKTTGQVATATISFKVTNNGSNMLNGGSGSDSTDGGQGDDILHGSLGADTLNGGSGIDTASYSKSSTAVTASLKTDVAGKGGDAEGDILDGIEILIGSNFGDDLMGNESDNTINGGGGADVMSGDAGNDTYYVDDTGDRVVETATGGMADVVYSTVSHTLASHVESLFALGPSSITLTGNSSSNTIYGNASANKINGGLGSDVLYGDFGKDIFVFSTRPSSSNVDRIMDYKVSDDTIQLENAVFTKLKAGKLASSAFWKGAKAHDKDDRIIYDSAKGYLYYDADGTGSSKQVLIATLTKNLKMSYVEFYVI